MFTPLTPDVPVISLDSSRVSYTLLLCLNSSPQSRRKPRGRVTGTTGPIKLRPTGLGPESRPTVESTVCRHSGTRSPEETRSQRSKHLTPISLLDGIPRQHSQIPEDPTSRTVSWTAPSPRPIHTKSESYKGCMESVGLY